MSVNRQLTKSVKTVVVSTGIVAGTTSTNCTTVDTLGYSGYRVVALLGALTATQVTSLKVQEFDTDTSGSYADVTGAATGAAADGDAGKLLILEVYKPQKRWIRPVVVRGTANAVITAVLVELYLPDFQPVATVDATNISAYKTLDNPV
jgi:hypothetical protein